jgi:hypothetical protein
MSFDAFPLMVPVPAPAAPPNVAEGRVTPRLKLPAMYTMLRAKLAGERRYRWSGHLYDISMSGLRFELDLPVPTGATIQVRAMLPGATHTTVELEGRVVRLHGEEDENGPVRMGMTIERFVGPADRRKLMDYLTGHGLRLVDHEAMPMRKAA